MNFLLIVEALCLLAAANYSPVLAKKVMGDRFAASLDHDVVLRDGRPLFGAAKTVRGIVLSLVSTVIVAMILGVDWTLGLLAGACAMAGDLLSSFTKRRLGYAASTRAPGLDHIPESLLPLLAISPGLGLSVADILVGTAAFWLGASALSPLLFRIGLRDRPH